VAGPVSARQSPSKHWQDSGARIGQHLKALLEAKKVFGWVQPQELRIAALQALENSDPEWVRDYLPKSGIDKEDLTLAPLVIRSPRNLCGSAGTHACG